MRIKPIRTWGLALLFCWPAVSQAVFYNSSFHSADLYPGPSVFSVAVEPAIFISKSEEHGFSANLHGYFPISTHLSGMVALGTGKAPFLIDAHLQWTVHPDFMDTFAFSIGGGASYLRINGENTISAYVYPIISKNFFWGGLSWTPYTMIPLGVSYLERQFVLPIKIALGAQVSSPFLSALQWYVELGVGILNSPTLFSFGLKLQFERSIDPL